MSSKQKDRLLTPEEYNLVIERYKNYPRAPSPSGRNELVESLNKAQDTESREQTLKDIEINLREALVKAHCHTCDSSSCKLWYYPLKPLCPQLESIVEEALKRGEVLEERK